MAVPMGSCMPCRKSYAVADAGHSSCKPELVPLAAPVLLWLAWQVDGATAALRARQCNVHVCICVGAPQV
jgi:hypothetical protein